MPTIYPVIGITDWLKEYKSDRPYYTVYVNTSYVRNGVTRRGHTISYDINKKDITVPVSEIEEHPDQFILIRRYKDSPSRVVRKTDYEKVQDTLKKKSPRK